MKADLELREVLLTTGLAQPVSISTTSSSVHAVCRLMSGQEKAWLRAIEMFLRKAAELGINLHVGTRLVLKDGVMVRGWDFGIDAKGSSALRNALEALKAVSQEVAEATPVETPIPAQRVVEQAPVEEVGDEVEPAPSPDRDSRRAAYVKKTNATAHYAEVPSTPISAAPAGYYRKPEVVFRGKAKDRRNRVMPVIIEEFPLPHMHGVDDMNVPNEKDRGAKTIAGE